MCPCASPPVFPSPCCRGWQSELSTSFCQLIPSDVPSHHLSPQGVSTGPNSSCRWGSCCRCPSTLGIVQPPSPAVVAQQIHFSTHLHYAVLQLQSLHSAIHPCCSAIRSTLTMIWLPISCCLLALYAAFPFLSNLLSPFHMRRFWCTGSFDVRGFLGGQTIRHCCLLLECDCTVLGWSIYHLVTDDAKCSVL